MADRSFHFAIDRGGTFTDVYAQHHQGHDTVKLLSVDPANYPDAPREGIRRILEKVTGTPHPRSQALDTSRIASIRMGTTVATNALLERNGERFVLCITQGFKDLLHIGTQARPDIFDLSVKCPSVLYEDVVEVEERAVLVQAGESKENTVVGVTGERVRVVVPLNRDKLKADLTKVYESGVRSIAVVLVHSYTFRDHEVVVGEIAKEIGFTQVSLSSALIPMIKVIPRGFTACADAYLTPHVHRYLQTFCSGFDEGLKNVDLLFMQSDGGLTPMDSFNGFRAILSGPAGGVVGQAMTTFNKKTKQPVIAFDMGGTSTDVSRYAGSYEHVFETVTAGVTVQAPQLDVNTVAAGGGSRLFYRSGMFVVGPESCSAHPGPVCYRKNGWLAITDANVVLGRVLPDFFPKIFGPNEDLPLDAEGARAAMSDVAAVVNKDLAEAGRPAMTVDEVAYGFIKVANESMCRPLRELTSARGYDTRSHVLACFGGAGGQHACAMARLLGIKTIFVHRFAGILSAYGFALADVVEELQRPCGGEEIGDDMWSKVEESLLDLATQACEKLLGQGRHLNRLEVEPYLNIRYRGTNVPIMTPGVPYEWRDGLLAKDAPGGDVKSYVSSFLVHYKREFGFTLPTARLILDDVRVRVVAKQDLVVVPGGGVGSAILPPVEPPAPLLSCPVFFAGGRRDTACWNSDALTPGMVVEGPAIILDKLCTIVVEPFCTARLTADSDIEITVGDDPDAGPAKSLESNTADPIALSVFGHRFMSIAEQMGRTLQRTAISTNIKERLDFSCALFDPTGGLVANAPHVPVHLGSMQHAVRFQVEHLKGKIFPGDVIMTNHPVAGGTHLPDITLITPVFSKDSVEGDAPVFFVASRGHHADIGGISPGSMPPHSRHIDEEGAAVISFKIVDRGEFQSEGVTQLLLAPAQYPGSSGARRLQDNLSDLQAQVAANQKGIRLVEELIGEYSLPVVQSYMVHIQAAAENAVRTLLKEVGARQFPSSGGVGTLRAEDFMDDGTPICLNVHVDGANGSAHFDFTGSGPEMWGNCNAPPSVTASAIIYSLRCMVKQDIPLNQGCLNPVTITIPPGSILSPSKHAAVVGGNVLTSQRVTDVCLKAFQAAAASQGCMNNLTFGNEEFGHYETIAGGAGAGPSWHGRSGVHTHMTNTHITDIEVMEKRFPCVVREFGLRRGSGGVGKYNGGDGVVRELEWRKPLNVSVLSERRSLAPFGLQGGGDGQRGMNLLFRKDLDTPINLGGKCAVQVAPGDRIRILTPGGGAFGQGNSESAGPGSCPHRHDAVSASECPSCFGEGEVQRTRQRNSSAR